MQMIACVRVLQIAAKIDNSKNVLKNVTGKHMQKSPLGRHKQMLKWMFLRNRDWIWLYKIYIFCLCFL